ncbi:uncharacterized protein [Paralichthys olivaceus]|uniref:uncharacterized protein n=1 Tax=Paralichthys olivaceus TaxID=8255 RepID=UPI0037537B61
MSMDSIMRAASLLLIASLCLLASWAFEVRASEGGDQAKSDIWTEVRMLRQMVVQQQVELRNMEARLKEAEIQAGEQELDLLQTKTHLEELRRDHVDAEKRLSASEIQGQELRQENTEQAAELTDLSVRLEVSERQVEKLKVELENNAVELLSTQARVTVNRNDVQLLQRRLDDAQTQNTAQDGKLSSLLDRTNTTEQQVDLLIKDNAKVAFYAALTDSEDVGPHSSPTVLKFSKVFTNVGKAYSATTGLFTAPVKGVYVFRFTICGYMKEGVTMGVRLFHNEKSIVYNLQTWSHERYGLDHFEYLSNAVVLELNVGDEIHLVLPENETIFDNYNSHSTLSGFLLFRM